jgi:hypothetical protein
MTVVKEIKKYKLILVRVQVVRWDRGGTEPEGEYRFLYEKRNENHELGTGFFVHMGIISTVKRVEFASVRVFYTTLKDHWYDIIVLNVYTPAYENAIKRFYCRSR